MIVFIAGMQRSGSTFSFNIVRELLEKRGPTSKEDSTEIQNILARSTGAEHILFKGHIANDMTLQLVRLGAIKTICTIRKPEDAIASWMQTFGFGLEKSIEDMLQWLAMFDEIRHHALVLSYDDINCRPRRAAMCIGRWICPSAGLMEILSIARRYSKRRVLESTRNLQSDGDNVKDIAFSYYDRETFFHRRHVSGLVSQSAAERIGQDAVSVIRARLRAFLDECGNLQVI
jgi:hypothetical protein